MGTSCENCENSSGKEEHLARTRGKDDEVRRERQCECLRRLVLKEQDRAERLLKDAQHFVVGAQDETTADQKDQRGASRAANTTTGNHGRWTTSGQMHERVCVHDKQYCEWAVQTVVAEGATALPQMQKFVTHVKQFLGTSQSKKVAQSDNEAGVRGRNRRLDETSETVAGDCLTTKTIAKSSAT